MSISFLLLSFSFRFFFPQEGLKQNRCLAVVYPLSVLVETSYRNAPQLWFASTGFLCQFHAIYEEREYIFSAKIHKNTLISVELFLFISSLGSFYLRVLSFDIHEVDSYQLEISRLIRYLPEITVRYHLLGARETARKGKC